MKTKTPLADLREDLTEAIESGKEALTEIEDLHVRKCCQTVLEITIKNVIKRIDEELLPKEKEFIENAFEDGFVDGINLPKINRTSKQYFEINYTQEQ